MGRNTKPIYGSFVFTAATEARPNLQFDFEVKKFDKHIFPEKCHPRACLFHRKKQRASETGGVSAELV